MKLLHSFNVKIGKVETGEHKHVTQKIETLFNRVKGGSSLCLWPCLFGYIGVSVHGWWMHSQVALSTFLIGLLLAHAQSPEVDAAVRCLDDATPADAYALALTAYAYSVYDVRNLKRAACLEQLQHHAVSEGTVQGLPGYGPGAARVWLRAYRARFRGCQGTVRGCQGMAQGLPGYGPGAARVRFRGCQGMVQGLPGYGSGAARVWFRGCQGMVQGLPGYGPGTARVWLRAYRVWFRGCQGMAQGLPGYGPGAGRVKLRVHGVWLRGLQGTWGLPGSMGYAPGDYRVQCRL